MCARTQRSTRGLHAMLKGSHLDPLSAELGSKSTRASHDRLSQNRRRLLEAGRERYMVREHSGRESRLHSEHGRHGSCQTRAAVLRPHGFSSTRIHRMHARIPYLSWPKSLCLLLDSVDASWRWKSAHRSGNWSSRSSFVSARIRICVPAPRDRYARVRSGDNCTNSRSSRCVAGPCTL